MKKRVLLSLCILVVTISGCGGGNATGQGQGATVALQSQITPGKATIFFSQYSSATSIQSLSPLADFTLKSIVNSNAGSMASDISITSEVISFEYVGSSPVGIGSNLSIPPITYYSNLIVPAGGTATWSAVPIMIPETKSYLKTNNPLSNQTDQLYYRVNIAFNGIEVKNGNNLSVNTTCYLNLSQ